MGSGTGLISFCIAYRCNNDEITGIEKNYNYYSLSIKSLKINKLKSKINFINKDISDVYNNKSDIIISNPPWFIKNTTYKSVNNLLNEAKIESRDLETWVKKVLDNLNYNGKYYTILPYTRIKEIKKIFVKYFSKVKIYPISSFRNNLPDKAIVYAKKSGNDYECLELEPIIIHKNDMKFMDNIDSILRKGNSLCLA